MTTRLGAAVAAGFLAIGILVGAAGTIVIRDATAPDPMTGMTGMIGMTGMASMMSMMGDHTWDGMMGGGSPMRHDASMPPAQHQAHHPFPSREPTR